MLAFVLALMPMAMAANLEVKKVDKGSVVISEIKNPAVFDFVITNNENKDNFEIYSLVGVSFSPRGTFVLEPGENTIEVRAYMNEFLERNRGFINFEYQIRGQNSGIFKDTLTVKIVDLKDTFSIKGKNIKVDDAETVVALRNIQNTNLEDVNVEFKSVFFEHEEKVSFAPFEEKNITIKLNKDKMKGLAAGSYVVVAEVDVEGKKEKFESIIHYLEKEGVFTEEKKSGLIVRHHKITKTNEGNIPTNAEIKINRNIITRLFSSYSQEPHETVRNGILIENLWSKQISPGESFSIEATTNYTFPFVLAVLVVIIVAFTKIYSLTALSVNKRVSFVRTKGGEFALRVSISVKARKYVDNVQLIDMLPNMVKLYEKFGRKPDKIEGRRLTWDLGTLNAGEERVFSYIIYSTIKTVGRFELPSATVVFESDGRAEEVFSNRAYFVSDTAIGDED